MATKKKPDTAESPGKGGRPSLYKPEYAEQAKKLCRLGATDKELADFFGVTEQTVNNWKTSYPEFFESLKNGKQLADAEVADKLFQRATGYSHSAVKMFMFQGVVIKEEYTEHYAPDTTAAIFWLKNRRRDLWNMTQANPDDDGPPLNDPNPDV